MKTLFSAMEKALAARDVRPLGELLATYHEEKDAAKSYSALAYLSCSGAGGKRKLAERMAETIEAFFLATSIHDDALDSRDGHVRRRSFSSNTYVVLGDCFFVRLAGSLARATPRMPRRARRRTVRRLEELLHDVAESQVADEASQGRIPTPEQATRQMRLRGGTWGRLCTEMPALAAGLRPRDAVELGAAAEDLFMALTLRDDLGDLDDDLQNGVLTLAPALFFERTVSEPPLHLPPTDRQTETVVERLHAEGAVDAALAVARSYAERAVSKLEAFLAERNRMDWYLLLMIFRLVRKKTADFTAEDVRQRRLGIGFSSPRPDGLATIGF